MVDVRLIDLKINNRLLISVYSLICDMQKEMFDTGNEYKHKTYMNIQLIKNDLRKILNGY